MTRPSGPRSKRTGARPPGFSANWSGPVGTSSTRCPVGVVSQSASPLTAALLRDELLDAAMILTHPTGAGTRAVTG